MRAAAAPRALRDSAFCTSAIVALRGLVRASAWMVLAGVLVTGCKPAVFISVTSRQLSEVRSSGGMSEASEPAPDRG